MNTYLDALATIGVGGVLEALDRCSAHDLELAKPEVIKIIPSSLALMSSQQWKVAVYRVGITLSSAFVDRNLLLLGSDITFLEALAAIQYKGSIKILPPFHLSEKEAVLMEKNVPSSLDAIVETPGQLPIVSSEYVVVILCFEAGGGYLLAEQDAVRMLGSIRGQNFIGDLVGLMPLDRKQVDDRPDRWGLMPVKNLSNCCRPGGLDAVRPNL